jgi:hypothetical protein
MKTRCTSRRLVAAFATTLSVGIIATAGGTAGAPSASAATLSASATSTYSCTFYNANVSPAWSAMDNASIKSDAWTASGSYVYLERYTDSLSQCWKYVGGFGHGEFEWENALSPQQCLRVDNAHPKSSGDLMTLAPCLSETFEKFISAAPAGPALAFAALEDTNLCVAADGSITPGVALVLATCNFSHQGQLWFQNITP